MVRFVEKIFSYEICERFQSRIPKKTKAFPTLALSFLDFSMGYKTFGCVHFFVLKCSSFSESNVCYKFRNIVRFFAVNVSLRNCFLVHGFQSSQRINFFHVTCARAGKFGGLSTATSFREIGKTC